MYLHLSGQRQLNMVEENIIGVHPGECFELEGFDGIVVVDTDNFERLSAIEIIGCEDLAKRLERILLPEQ